MGEDRILGFDLINDELKVSTLVDDFFINGTSDSNGMNFVEVDVLIKEDGFPKRWRKLRTGELPLEISEGVFLIFNVILPKLVRLLGQFKVSIRAGDC